jgi:hypothetical protein
MKGNLNVYVSFFVGNIPAYGHISDKVWMIDSPMHLLPRLKFVLKGLLKDVHSASLS